MRWSTFVLVGLFQTGCHASAPPETVATVGSGDPTSLENESAQASDEALEGAAPSRGSTVLERASRDLRSESCFPQGEGISANPCDRMWSGDPSIGQWHLDDAELAGHIRALRKLLKQPKGVQEELTLRLSLVTSLRQSSSRDRRACMEAQLKDDVSTFDRSSAASRVALEGSIAEARTITRMALLPRPYSKLDVVRYLLAYDLDLLGRWAESERVLRDLLARFPRSSYLPRAEVLLARVVSFQDAKSGEDLHRSFPSPTSAAAPLASRRAFNQYGVSMCHAAFLAESRGDDARSIADHRALLDFVERTPQARSATYIRQLVKHAKGRIQKLEAQAKQESTGTYLEGLPEGPCRKAVPCAEARILSGDPLMVDEREVCFDSGETQCACAAQLGLDGCGEGY